MLPLVALLPVMLWGTATHHVIAVALPPVVPPRSHGHCGVVMPQGTAVCHIAVVLPLIAPP